MSLKDKASRVLAAGVLAVGASAVPVVAVPVMAAVAHANGCGGGGVPGWGGGGGCDYVTPDGNHVQCGFGYGVPPGLPASGGGGGCHIWGGPAGDFVCDVSVHVHARGPFLGIPINVDIDHAPPCPYVS